MTETPDPPTLRDVLSPLLEIQEQATPFAARHLLACLKQMEFTQQQLRNREAADEETLADQDRCEHGCNCC